MKYLRLVVTVAVVLWLVYYFEGLSTQDAAEQASGVVYSEDTHLASTNMTAADDYQQARAVFWGALYPKSVTSLYCGEVFQSNQRSGFNIEHVFPMSWVTNALTCGTRDQCRVKSAIFNRIEADLHNLYPTRTDINQARSSFAFNEISGEQRRFGKECDFEVSEKNRVAEPASSVRGEVARAMLYMAHQYREYGLILFSKQLRLLQDWHRSDPPNEIERLRNDKIEDLQGNRNPFIDDPDYLDRLIAQGFFS